MREDSDRDVVDAGRGTNQDGPLLSRARITRGGAAASFSGRRRARHDSRG